MHDTALEIGENFFKLYLDGDAPHILDLGSANYNGSLRDVMPHGAIYVGADMADGPGVDVVLADLNELPFDANRFDAVVSSSVFEHAQFFWINFLEMIRVTKPGGYVYINAPSNGFYHTYPHDNWRFYPDAGVALELWARHAGESLYLVESFTARRKADSWNDFVAVFRKLPASGEVPARLLADEYNDAFNIRTFRSPEVINTEARSEDMLLKDVALAEVVSGREHIADIEADLSRHAELLARSEEQAQRLLLEITQELSRVASDAGRNDERARQLEADLEASASRERSAAAIAKQLREKEADLKISLDLLCWHEAELERDVASLESANLALRERLLTGERREREAASAFQRELAMRGAEADRLRASLSASRQVVEQIHSFVASELQSAGQITQEIDGGSNPLPIDADGTSDADSGRIIGSMLSNLRSIHENQLLELKQRLAAADQELVATEMAARSADAEKAALVCDLQLSKMEQGRLAREVSSMVSNHRQRRGSAGAGPVQAGKNRVLALRNSLRRIGRSIGQTYFGKPSQHHRLLRNLVDPTFYHANYTDVREAGHPALDHYIRFGWQERRNPNAWFDTNWYLSRNPDVEEAGVNPLEHYVRHGWMEGRNPGPDFDIEFYLLEYADVRADGVEPLTHFLLHGHAEGRLPHGPRLARSAGAPALLSRAVSEPPSLSWSGRKRFEEDGKALRIVLISSDSASPSHVYRIENMARGLVELGCHVETVPLHELWRIIDRIGEFHAAVFWRIAIGERFGWSRDIERILRDCRAAGIATFFDVDDLVFDPTICTPEFVDGLRYLDESELQLYDEGVRGYRDLLLSCNAGTVTTTSLRQAAERFGVRTFVVPNGLDAKYEEALQWPLLQHERDKVVIGYTPGTKTHQKDFAEAAAALERILDKRPEAQLWILGPLDLGEFPELAARVGSQVFLDPSVGRDRVLAFNQRIDITVIPLELNNPFTAAKSELKYFETAVFGVPSVASLVGPYAECIADGVNGFVAGSESEWFEKLDRLVADRALRHAMGSRAREAIRAEYAARPVASKLLAAIEMVRSDLRDKAAGKIGWTIEDLEETWPSGRGYQGDRPLEINWIINGLLVGGGGHRMLLRAAHHLSRFGHRVRLYFTDTDHTLSELRQLLHRHFFPMDCPIYIYRGTMKPADVVFATYWKTVDVALRHADVCKNLFYFVQDFEPYFFAMGSDYIQAENTYRQGLYGITAGPWCAHFIRNQFGGEADHFVFPIEGVYSPGDRSKRNKNLVFFAKPEMPRRCYEIGVQVLAEVHKLRPDVELILFGSREVDAANLPFPATCRGVLSVSELAQMYRDADVGLAFSPTNPSAVPYEMMACGLPVVDMARPHAEENYGGRFDLVKLANPVPARMAEEIVALLDDSDERARRSKSGLEFVSENPTEEDMGRRIETLVVERVRKMSAARQGAETHSRVPA